jgi:sortase A
MKKYLNIKNIAITGLFLTGMAFAANGIWIKAKATLAQILLDQAFLASSDGPVKPWAWADVTPMGRLSAPGIIEASIVLEGTSGEAMAFGPGHLYGTPMPGEAGTSVLAGHRDTHFAWIRNLKPGDQVTLERTDGTLFSYQVRRAWVARFDNSGINTESPEKLLALTTCWPFDAKVSGDMRYVVEAVQTSREEPDQRDYTHRADDDDELDI